MKRIYLTVAFFVLCAALWSARSINEYSGSTPVNEYLVSLGQPQRNHYVEDIQETDIKKGEELIKYGRTIGPNGRKSKYISKYFKCTSCHNTIKEVAVLTNENDPPSRLAYAMENDIPFLQASTFFGIVNKDSWYNDDYEKKYGSLVEPARKSLKESIQLCAQECSQGRRLEDWEMKMILSYLWSLQLKMEDLDMTESDKASLAGKMSNEAKVALIKSKYSTKNGATFGHVPEDKAKGYGLEGNPKNGAFIYSNSCQHCHRVGGESDLVLDNGQSTFRWLKNNLTKHTQISMYEIIKKGTYAQAGHREYMPLYSEEKMNNQQVEDLRAYIEQEAQ